MPSGAFSRAPTDACMRSMAGSVAHGASVSRRCKVRGVVECWMESGVQCVECGVEEFSTAGRGLQGRPAQRAGRI